MHQVNSYIKNLLYAGILLGAPAAFCSQITHKHHNLQQNIEIRDKQRRQYSLNEEIYLNTLKTQEILQNILAHGENASLNEINRATGYAINCFQVALQLSENCRDKEQKDDFELQAAQLKSMTAQFHRKFAEKLHTTL